MNKIFRYELRRMVFSKFYLGLSAVTIWYGWQLLNTTTILGTAHTAPFSPWSFGSYLSQLLPLLCVPCCSLCGTSAAIRPAEQLC